METLNRDWTDRYENNQKKWRTHLAEIKAEHSLSCDTMSETSLYIRKRVFDNFKSKTEDGDRLY